MQASTSSWLPWIALILAGFLCGSVPFGVILAKAHGVDLRKVGSGNVGATNVGRALGRRWGFVCFGLDAAKGAAPVIVAGMLMDLWSKPVTAVPPVQFLGWIAVVFASLLGHVFSPWIGFKGGKGVATGFGAMASMWPLLTFPALLALATWIASMKLTRIVSLSSMVAAWSLPLWCGLLLRWPEAGDPGSPAWPVGTTALLALLVMVTHRANIGRLLAGTEPRVGVKPPATIAT